MLTPAVGKNRNIMLYWDDANPFPQDIIAVTEKWRNVCPAWNFMLFGQETACDNLRENFGGGIARLFLFCGIPAMRADFFRVVWAISDGGICSDMTGRLQNSSRIVTTQVKFIAVGI